MVNDYDELVDTAKDVEFEKAKIEPVIKKPTDGLSNMIGDNFWVQGRYENWYKDAWGNRIKFDRYYPAQQLYIDMFDEEITDEDIKFKRTLVEANGKKYLPVRMDEQVIKIGNKLAAAVIFDKKHEIKAEIELK